ncbi:hypothetical protein ACPV3A_36130 [Paenibacillus sp. Dod16]|uniref:hypothetical protein n=1 Tax=Paenibacillus sp. Dod16 TaxID=3416392 RepID=UPI003CF18A36
MRQESGSRIPIELFQVVEIYGDLTVQSLINKRIVLRKGQRLILYWDIFRDYILTGTVPHIPVAYIPQTQYRRYCDALMVLLKQENLTLTNFALKLGVGRDAAENIVRDLVMIGNANRQGEDLKLLQNNEEEAYNKIVEFFNKHILYLNIIEGSGVNFQITMEEFGEYFNETYESSMFSEKTRKTYMNIIYGWMSGARLIETKFHNLLNVVDRTNSSPKNEFPISSGRKVRRTSYFLGEAPPTRVLELIEQIKKGNTDTMVLNKSGYRNSISLLTNIGGLILEGNHVSLIQMPENTVLWLAEKIMKTSTVEIVGKYSNFSPTELGGSIAKELGKNWTTSSQKRYGSALLLWYKWGNKVLNAESVGV